MTEQKKIDQPADEKSKGTAGRPSTRTYEIEEKIITGLMEGNSLVKVCEEEGMPNRRTVMRWMEADEDFASRCARAREMQADLMDDKIIDLIDRVDIVNYQAEKVKLAALQWRAAKLAPKRYGDKLGITDGEGGALKVMIQRFGENKSSGDDNTSE